VKKSLHEQYIVPPLGEFLLTGDILLDCSADPKEPASYKLVLTPSCDMVLYPGKPGKPPKSKVSKVLCARCESAEVFVQQALNAYAKDGVKATEEDGVKAIKSILSQGYYKEFIPLPELERVFDSMVANLKKLDLVPYEEIINGKYRRIVSVDSPFREQMTWAFLHTGCRPGVPDRDTETWAKQYVKIKPSAEKK
jgi:CTP synthase